MVIQTVTQTGSSLLTKAAQIPTKPLRCVTVDVTGTLIGYKGLLGDYYCMAAKAAGLPCPDYTRMHEGFKIAYKEMDSKYPCFGKVHNVPNRDWWRLCVQNAFCQVRILVKESDERDLDDPNLLRGMAGYDYREKEFDIVFKRIYSIFGSAAPYVLYQDAQPFLRWVRKQGILVGVVSNASYRYRDFILPTLGLNQGSEWDFGVFSGIEGVEKPNPEIFEIAMARAGNVLPEEMLHIGDSLRKDFMPARGLAMHALLLDRFSTGEARAAKEMGVPVVTDLSESQHYIVSHQEQAGAPIV